MNYKLPNGFGIDIVDNNRIEFNDINFAKRYMSKNEYLNFKKIKNLHQQRMYMIGIWAIKESIVKAINHQLIFSSIDIVFTNEAPICNLDGYQLFISISYEKKFTVASTISYKI